MRELQQMLQEMQAIVICVALLVGAVQCFFGYKLFRVMTAIIGFIVGGIIGAALGYVMLEEVGMFLGLLVLGILGALLAYTLYKVGVFIICFGAGAVLGLLLAMMMDDSSMMAPFMTIVGLVFGVIGVILTKPLIILSTGVGGGMSMGLALAMAFSNMQVGIFLGVVLSIVGILFQFYTDKKAVAGGAPDAGSGASAAAGGFPIAAQPREPGSPLTLDGVKSLTTNDLTSRQAICGAVAWGVLGFGFLGVSLLGIVVTLVLIAVGVCTGGCANRAGIEYFAVDQNAFQNRRVAIGAGVGAALGLFAFAVPGLSIGLKLWTVFFWLKSGAAIGYLLEMRSRYKAVYGGGAPAASAPAAAPSGASAAPAFRVSIPTINRSVSVNSGTRLWAQDLPIVVTEPSVTPKPEDATQVSLSVSFQNISEQAVIAVYLGVKCFNLLNQELAPVEKLTIQDFTLEPGKLWTYRYPHPLPDGDTRRVELIVRHVVMADGSTWDCEEGRPLTALKPQPPLALDAELAKQFFLDCSGLTKGPRPQSVFKYQPQERGSHWDCACGQMNLGNTCLSCGIGRQELFERIDQGRLTQNYTLRKEEERRLEEERRQKIEAQKQAVKDKAAEAKNKSMEAVAAAKNKSAELWKQLTEKKDKEQ